MVTSLTRPKPKYVIPRTVIAQRDAIRAKIGQKQFQIVARRGSYRSANNPRSRVQTPYGGTGDVQADPWTRRILRELSRDMDRNSDTYKTLLNEWVNAIVGTGVRALPRSKDEQWNQEVAKLIDNRFSSQRNGLDARKMRTWYQLQGDYVRAVGGDGDAGILRLADGTVQLIESEQITSGVTSMTVGPLNFADGIKMGPAGDPIEFTIVPYDRKTGAPNYGVEFKIPYDYIEFVALKTRISQTRGVPLLCAGLEDWERIDSYKESEVIGAEQGSMIYGVLEYPEGNLGFGGTFTPGMTGNDSQPQSPGYIGGQFQNGNIDWHEAVAGNMMELPNGVKYVPVNPQRPNRDCAPFLIEMIRQFCANAGLPYEIVYNDLRGLSWSIQRALIAMAREKILAWQKNYFAVPFGAIYLWQVQLLIAEGAINEVEGWDQFDLSWPELPWPDEGKEYEAQTLGLRSRLTTRHRVHGASWKEIIDESMLELEYASELVLKYNTMYPDFKLTPKEVLGLEDAEKKIGGADEKKDEETNTPRTKESTQ